MNELQSFIDNYLALAKFRNVSADNPIKFEVQPDPANPASRFIVVVSPVEPTFARLPYNVIWIPSDVDRPDFGSVLKRIGHLPADIYSATWEAVTEYSSLWLPDQYYQSVVEDPRLHGIETESDVLGPATTIEHGLVLLGSDHPEARAVELADPRNRDPRYPKFHSHPDFPRTMIAINDNDYALVSTSAPPQQGMLLFIVGRSETNPNEWIAVWRFPTEDDLVVIDRSLIAIRIDGAATMAEQTLENYTVTAIYADLRQEVVSPSNFVVSNPTAAGITLAGELTAGNIQSNTTVTITATYTEDGNTVQTSHDVLITTGVEITTLQIVGPDAIDENTIQQYVVRALFSDGSSADVTPDTIASTQTQHATVTPEALVTATEVNGGDKNTTLQATYSHDGVERSASKTITIIDTDPLINNIEIVGPDTVAENSTTGYQFKLIYSDGSEVFPAVPTSFTQTTSTYSSISGTDFISNEVSQDRTVRLEATFTEYGRTVATHKDVTITDALPVPVSAQILGADSIEEQTSSNYLLEVTFDSGATQTFSDAAWSVSVGGTYATVNASGQLTGQDVETDQTVTLSATRTVYGVDFTSITKQVSITASAPVPVLLELEAPGGATVNEGETVPITYTVHYSDGSQVDVKSSPGLSVSFIGSPHGATFVGTDSNDVQMGEVVGSKAVTVRGSYTEGATTVTDNLALGVQDGDISPRWGIGPQQQNLASYTQTAFYEDILTNSLTGVSGETFSYASGLTFGDYVYIMYPVELGYARIKEAGQTFHGAYDSAAVTIDGGTFGEVKVTIGDNDYYVYRNDFAPNPAGDTVTVDYGRAEYNSSI